MAILPRVFRVRTAECADAIRVSPRLREAACLPFSPVGPALGFRPLPQLYWPLILLTLLCYALLTQIVKEWLLHHRWI